MKINYVFNMLIFTEVARRFPKLEQSITCLNLWAAQIEAKLGTDLTECPSDFLPNMHVQVGVLNIFKQR